MLRSKVCLLTKRLDITSKDALVKFAPRKPSPCPRDRAAVFERQLVTARAIASPFAPSHQLLIQIH